MNRCYPDPTRPVSAFFDPGTWFQPAALACLLAIHLSAVRSDEPIEPPLRPGDRLHWSFVRPARAELPRCRNQQWARSPVDSFVSAKLEAAQLSPSVPADPLTLIRRATFDLTGLPPTPAEIDRYLDECRIDADTGYTKLIDRLLDSPHYGEHWARHWLDVVRYAESNGYEADGERPGAWRYRDYVIRSFNDDKPFDQFVKEQIAGDYLAVGKDPRTHADLWIATGLHRCGPNHLVGGNVDPAISRNEVLTEMVMGVGSAFLGLTMTCARCHDHKFDPISQADYYRLEAFFASTRAKDVDFSTTGERTNHQLKLLGTMAKLAPIKAQVAAIDAPYQTKLREAKKAKLGPVYIEALASDPKNRTPEQERRVKEAGSLLKVTWDEVLAVMSPGDRERREKFRAEQHALEAELPMPPSQAWAVVDDGKVTPTYLLKRGEINRRGPVVLPAFPRVLVASDAKELNRKDLAEWLVSPEHPLTARVFVNRVWQHHFGRGIVGTPNDFGTRGERPTHPELLDYLATEFVKGGWKIKELHRTLMRSNTYRQSSAVDPVKEKVDPENRLLHRMNRQRLTGESLRDAMLASAGTLNRQQGGPMVRVPLEPEVYDLIFTEGEPDGLWTVTADKTQHTRRSIYLFAKRNVRQPILEAFDQPDTLTPCAVRGRSTYAPQALILMNGPLAQAQSKALASRILNEATASPIDQAFRLTLGRRPTDKERAISERFLGKQRESFADRLRKRLPVHLPEGLPKAVNDADALALAELCLALFNSNEFVYVR